MEKSNLKQFNVRQQNKLKKWRGMSTFARDCMLNIIWMNSVCTTSTMLALSCDLRCQLHPFISIQNLLSHGIVKCQLDAYRTYFRISQNSRSSRYFFAYCFMETMNYDSVHILLKNWQFEQTVKLKLLLIRVEENAPIKGNFLKGHDWHNRFYQYFGAAVWIAS